jgi:hypothetical protein
VAFTGVAYVLARQAVRTASIETYFPASQYLGVRLEMDREPAQGGDTTRAEFLRRYAADARELERWLMDGKPVAAGTPVGKSIVRLATRLLELDKPASGKRQPAGGLLAFLSRN